MPVRTNAPPLENHPRADVVVTWSMENVRLLKVVARSSSRPCKWNEEESVCAMLSCHAAQGRKSKDVVFTSPRKALGHMIGSS